MESLSFKELNDLQNSPKDSKGARVWCKNLPSKRQRKKQHRSSLGHTLKKTVNYMNEKCRIIYETVLNKSNIL